jgi:type II secretory pathway pseudopilin PulG
MIEMLLVLVLLVTTASLALPAFAALLSRSDDQQAVAVVRNTLRAVRQLAIDSGTAQQWPPEMVSNGADDATVSDGGNAKVGKLKRGYSIDLNATQPIVFQPNGCARDGRIVIQGPRGEVAVLLVVGATGSILNEGAAR